MRDWWLSTPRYTVWLRTDAQDRILDCAPILWHRWRKKPLETLLRDVWEQWGWSQCALHDFAQMLHAMEDA